MLKLKFNHFTKIITINNQKLYLINFTNYQRIMKKYQYHNSSLTKVSVTSTLANSTGTPTKNRAYQVISPSQALALDNYIKRLEEDYSNKYY